MLSATSFTLVGVVNKFLTILLNVLVWDKHSTGLGLVAVSICLIAGVFYEQPPRRAEPTAQKATVDETEKLLETKA
jgi:solute carrier family 35 protein